MRDVFVLEEVDGEETRLQNFVCTIWHYYKRINQPSNLLIHIIHINLSPVFCGDLTAVSTGELIPDKGKCIARYIDLSDFAPLLHLGGKVYRIAPDIIYKFPVAYHSCYHRPGMYADAHFKDRQVLCFGSKCKSLYK